MSSCKKIQSVSFFIIIIIIFFFSVHLYAAFVRCKPKFSPYFFSHPTISLFLMISFQKNIVPWSVTLNAYIQHISEKYMNFLLHFSHFFVYVHVRHLALNFLSDNFSFKLNSIFLRFHFHHLLLLHLHPLHSSSPSLSFHLILKRQDLSPHPRLLSLMLPALKIKIHSSPSAFFVFLFKQTLHKWFLDLKNKGRSQGSYEYVERCE